MPKGLNPLVPLPKVARDSPVMLGRFTGAPSWVNHLITALSEPPPKIEEMA